jgi:integrase
VSVAIADRVVGVELAPATVSAVVVPAARVTPVSWPDTRRGRAEVLELMGSAPFVVDSAARQGDRRAGLRLMLDWLEDQPGLTWQDRWVSSGAEAAGAGWRQVPAAWLDEHGRHSEWSHDALAGALVVAICADVVRPSLDWMLCGATARSLIRNLAASRDPDGFAQLRARCDGVAEGSAATRTQVLYRGALIVASKGGVLRDITVGDVVELLNREAEIRVNPLSGGALFYRVLHEMGILGAQAPATLRVLRTSGQRSAEELIDRHRIVCRPVRDVLVDYLRERQPALDYTSLDSLANFLGKLFWADIEAHHPGIDTLRLPVGVADAWKRRLRTFTKTTSSPTGDTTRVTVERINYRACLTPVRAFYLDLAHWAVEDPGRWGPWVAPCPISDEEINSRKAFRHRKSRMDARTRERLPVLPVVVRAVDQRRKTAAALLDAGRRTRPGEAFSAEGTTLVRYHVDRGGPATIWAEDPITAKRRNLSREEDHAFWAWAIVEVLRATGVRVEELVELSHHSLVQYRLPTTGELVPLLQILPSKTDEERLLVVSPDLADVLSEIIRRNRTKTGAVPLLSAYDARERVWSPLAPLLFQRRVGTENRAIPKGAVGRLLAEALAHTGLLDAADGRPLHYTPHDFRRMFITDAILNGLPPHIAQIIAGHRDINVTLGYKAVYPEEAIQAHLGFLARRRSLRPSEEYRIPTDDEWEQFLGHFERRKVSLGTCARAFATPCIHEHACVRCPMLWPDPNQKPRLIELRDNLTARIAEAHREGWSGEVEGLEISLAGAQNKLAQVERSLLGRQRHLEPLPSTP